MIREAREDDYAAWLPLWDAYNAFYGRVGATALQEAVTRATWARFGDPRQPMHALVAEEGDRVVGLAHYLFHRTTIALTDNCYLQDLFVAPAARGRGLATALVAAVCERARAANATRVYWQTHESNAVARRLYDRIAERSGFIVYRVML